MNELIEIQILYFAVLKDKTGQNGEILSIKKKALLHPSITNYKKI
jgi:molybdopterin converting factor small subunit